jgi:hypothetical protein
VTEAELVELIDAFFAPGLDVDEAVRRFGPIVPSHLPDRVVLAPTDASLERGHVELLDGAVAGLSLRFTAPLRVHLAPLVARLGPAREGVRLRPGDEIPLQLGVETAAFEGYVVLSVEGRHEGDEQPVRGVILRRFARAGAAG